MDTLFGDKPQSTLYRTVLIFSVLPSTYYFCLMYLYFFPLIAACIGWLLHWILINYLFTRILPRRIPVVAERAGQLLVTVDGLPNGLVGEDVVKKTIVDLTPVIENHIDIFLKEKLKEKMPAIAMFVGEKTIEMMKSSLMEEINMLLPELLKKFGSGMKENLDPGKLLPVMLSKIPEGRMEEILIQNTRKERRMLQAFGAVSGFIIGCVLLLLIKIQ